MKANTTLNRRALLLGGAATAGVAAGLTACQQQPARREPWVYDPENPADLAKAYAKIAGAIDERQLYLQYYGAIMAVLPGEKHRPLFRLKGLVRQRWKPMGDNGYSYVNYDHGLFCDWETGNVLEQYENPFTGKVNKPLHYNSGPVQSTVGLGEGQENPLSKDWQVVGNQVVVTQTRVSGFTNPLAPDIYPKASTGEEVRSTLSSTYFADGRDIADPSLPGVDASHVWVYATGFPAWLKVGEKPGYALWTWSAKKFLDKSEIDPYILGEIESRLPGFLSVEKPWPEQSDGWTQYAREREPDLS